MARKTPAPRQVPTLAEFRATVDAAKAKARANFQAQWGVECTAANVETAVRACVFNADLFRPA